MTVTPHASVEELASARLELSRLLSELAERPELLLTRSPDELLGPQVEAFHASLAAIEVRVTNRVHEDNEREPTQEVDTTPAVVDRRHIVQTHDAVDGEGSPGGGSTRAATEELLELFTRLHESGDSGDIQHEVRGLLDVGLPELPRRTLGVLVHLIVASLRRSDVGAFFPAESTRRLAEMFRMIRDDCTEPLQLYVHGMARKHEPAHGETWAHDAAYYLGELDRESGS